MYFTQLISLIFLAVSVFADFNTFQDVYSSITDSLLEFEKAITSINPDLESIDPVKPASVNVVNTMQAGKKAIAAVPALTVHEMRLFVVTAKTLMDATNFTMMRMETKKSIIDETKSANVVLEAIKNVYQAAKELIAVVLTKVPEEAMSVAQDQANDVFGSFEAGVRFLTPLPGLVRRRIKTF